jgi:hypothetical protein
MSSIKDSLFLRSSATAPDPHSSNLIRHFSTFDSTSAANFSNGSNSSVTWVDLTGNGNATVQNVNFDTSTNLFTTSSSTNINLGDVLGSSSTAQTLTTELWFKVDSSKNEAYVLGSSSRVAHGGGFAVYIEGPSANDDFGFSKYYASSGSSGTDANKYVNVGNVSTGVFHQYVYAFTNSATIYAWVDGQSITGGTYSFGSQSSASNTVNTQGDNMHFGSFSTGTNSLIGEGALIRLYSDVLSDAEVLNNYNASKALFGLT